MRRRRLQASHRNPSNTIYLTEEQKQQKQEAFHNLLFADVVCCGVCKYLEDYGNCTGQEMLDLAAILETAGETRQEAEGVLAKLRLTQETDAANADTVQ
jgi:hypothetical protein